MKSINNLTTTKKSMKEYVKSPQKNKGIKHMYVECQNAKNQTERNVSISMYDVAVSPQACQSTLEHPTAKIFKCKSKLQQDLLPAC